MRRAETCVHSVLEGNPDLCLVCSRTEKVAASKKTERNRLKCIGDVGDACRKCKALDIECVRRRDTGSQAPSLSSDSTAAHAPSFEETHPFSPRNAVSLTNDRISSRPLHLGDLPDSPELDNLIHLYFSSVHHFGFFAFIHPLHFHRLLAEGNAPSELTLMMIASAMRFAAPVSPENLARADAWADAAIAALLPRIYQGFGAVQLMAILLAQHYDHNRGKFTSAWLLGGSCTRMMQMMSLHTFDRTYPASFPSHHRLSPLLSREALRRVAWCTFYQDSMTDGGRYGSHTIEERAYRIQLPCDQESFLGNDDVVTEPLLLGHDVEDATADSLPHASLDMSAYVLRTAAARRRILQFAFRASYQEQSVERLSRDLLALQTDLEAVVDSLPRRFHFNADNKFIHRDRLPTFILLHVLRENLFIILGRAALQVYLRDPTKIDSVSHARRSRIARALAVANIVSDAMDEGIIFDPHIGIQAYVALEILLFEPRRLAGLDESCDPRSPETIQGIIRLLKAIRDISSRSETVQQLYLEAIDRLLRCDCRDLLDRRDLAVIQSKHPLVGQDIAEYDFRDHRGAKLERLSQRRGVPGEQSISEAHDEVLLDDSVVKDPPGPSTSLRVNDLLLTPPTTRAPHSASAGAPDSTDFSEYDLGLDGQRWTELIEPDNTDHLFSSLNWLWPFDELQDPINSSMGLPGSSQQSTPQ
ncbi:hypothetical protein BJX99DRAFT_258211 [Aspergillus californicus]